MTCINYRYSLAFPTSEDHDRVTSHQHSHIVDEFKRWMPRDLALIIRIRGAGEEINQAAAHHQKPRCSVQQVPQAFSKSVGVGAAAGGAGDWGWNHLRRKKAPASASRMNRWSLGPREMEDGSSGAMCVRVKYGGAEWVATRVG